MPRRIRHPRRPRAGDLAVRRRRVRQRRQHMAASTAGRVRRPADAAAGQAGADPQADYSGVGYRPTSRQRMAIGADSLRPHHRHRPRGAHRDLAVRRLRGRRDDRSPSSMYSSPNMRSAYRVVPLDINPGRPTCGGPVPPRGRSRWSPRWTTSRTGSASIRSSCGCATNPTATSQTVYPFSTRRLTECLRQGADTFGWSRRNPTPREARDGDQLDRHRHGRRGLPHIAGAHAPCWPGSTPTAPPTWHPAPATWGRAPTPR